MSKTFRAPVFAVALALCLGTGAAFPSPSAPAKLAGT